MPRQGFPSILEAARARNRHPEAHWLIKTSLAHRGHIPSSFDDRLPEEAFTPPGNAYKRSPGTFFSVLRPVSKDIKTPLDAYDFFFESYSKSSREKLLEFMAQSPEIERLRTLSQRELAEEYAAGLATAMWATLGPPKD